jgi:hypothetical protein
MYCIIKDEESSGQFADTAGAHDLPIVEGMEPGDPRFMLLVFGLYTAVHGESTVAKLTEKSKF